MQVNLNKAENYGIIHAHVLKTLPMKITTQPLQLTAVSVIT